MDNLIINVIIMPNLHIVKRPEGWGVKQEKSVFDSGSFPTQESAFQTAKNRAEVFGGEVFVHDHHGKIRERNTSGKDDPFPPRG